MADKDPFAKYGGAALAANDPFAKYGGAAIATARSAPAGPAQAHWGSSLGDVIDTVGSHAANLVTGPINAVMHPYNTFVQPTVTAGSRAISQAQQGHYSDAARSAESAIPIVGPWADQIENDVQNKGAVAGLAGLATDVLGPEALAKGAGALPAAAEKAAPGIINKTIGARKGDFARGANPGRGYLDAGLGPSGSMESIADKAADARSEVGQALGNAYTKADSSGKLISADTVRKAIKPIMDDATAKAAAPGVVADPGAYKALSDSFEPALQSADANGGFTPSQLWNIRKTMNESLNWGDQSKLNLTKTQQRVSGALGGLLEDAVPDAADLNQNYQDLSKLHARASERAATGTTSLGGMVAKGVASGVGGALGHATGGPGGGLLGAVAGGALESIPAKTALASGLNATGKVLRPVANAASAAALPATLAAVSGNAVAQNPRDEHDQQGEQSATDSSEPSVQASPSTESIAPASTPATLKPLDRDTAEGYYDQAGGDPNAARDLAAKGGYDITGGSQ